MTRLVVHIDRVVISGFNPKDTGSISNAVGAELERQFGTPSMSSISFATPPGQIDLGMTAQRIGQAIALKIAGGVR
jgi:hypothetical protein